jgi:hypothetical protein
MPVRMEALVCQVLIPTAVTVDLDSKAGAVSSVSQGWPLSQGLASETVMTACDLALKCWAQAGFPLGFPSCEVPGQGLKSTQVRRMVDTEPQRLVA